ncbi:hypothetical protein A3K24_01515 [candidate division Kazan bacterium RIFCSPHIGHO2_01_FULL_44_14]|uniref:Methyltransferase type 11 domain-containing protein n=1 Tax=candidate division Kazan bacterium RIFCSPLOWO2_01_FULL_45_19 TaxID=1798538 RepID=A0A1F4NPY4_UNCK3|nr:MAG: hypothetical protein A3K51_01515 [candidate division Kazan bacterium RIFCSPLOWO2_01_FULL_45_19]OGB77759.1 MAG: hypothetical protein A3K24_01515 [candidate division Kazan bacterium RIFCSPHIGHO2_01_FULL_44_14]
MSVVWPIGNRESDKLERQVILKRLKKIRAQKMLDAGSGQCVFTKQMASIIGANEVHAIDIQAYSNECAEANIHFVTGDLNKSFPYPNGYFDIITSIHTIEHLTDTDSYLDEIFRTLKPGGLLLLDTVNLAALHYRVMLLFGYYPMCMAPSRYKISPAKGEHPPYPHKSVFTYRALIEVARKHGFGLVEGLSHTIYPLPTFLGNIICKIWPNIGLYTSLLFQKPIS